MPQLPLDKALPYSIDDNPPLNTEQVLGTMWFKPFWGIFYFPLELI